MNALVAGTPTPKPAPKPGDRVVVLWTDKGGFERENLGWLLPSEPGVVLLASHPDDDGSDPRRADWWRARFAASAVSVVVL